MKLEWLGVNGFRLTDAGKTVMIDPYVTRNRETLCCPETVRERLPVADAVFVCHSHWDHLADVPALARRTGCTVVGSTTTVAICAALGVPEKQLRTAPPGERIAGDCWAVTLLPSRHIPNGPDGTVLYAGTYSEPPERTPQSAPDFLEGGTYAIVLEFGGNIILNIGSADLPPGGLPPVKADILLVSISGRKPDFLERVFACVSPRSVVPSHHDRLQDPVGSPAPESESVRQAYADIRRLAPNAQLLTPAPFEPLDLRPQP
jgi:L-ascorbate metabolism protein UlaG (beta-lactamase superfamily)